MQFVFSSSSTHTLESVIIHVQLLQHLEIGDVNDSRRIILIYDFMENDNLVGCLFNQNKPIYVSWLEHYKIGSA